MWRWKLNPEAPGQEGGPEDAVSAWRESTCSGRGRGAKIRMVAETGSGGVTLVRALFVRFSWLFVTACSTHPS